MLSFTKFFLFFFFNDTAPTEIYTLSLHDALPIFMLCFKTASCSLWRALRQFEAMAPTAIGIDRKSTRLNSSHGSISYAVFCLKKKKKSGRHIRYPENTPIITLCCTIPDQVGGTVQ